MAVSFCFLYPALATGWTIWGSILGRGKRFLSSPECPDWLWGLHSLVFSGTNSTAVGASG